MKLNCILYPMGKLLIAESLLLKNFNLILALGLPAIIQMRLAIILSAQLKQKLRKGEWPARHPYGYQNITNADGKKDIIVDEYASAMVQKVFELYATASLFNGIYCEYKLKNDYGIKWSKGFMDKVLKDHFYYGNHGMERQNAIPIAIRQLSTKNLFDQVQTRENRI